MNAMNVEFIMYQKTIKSFDRTEIYFIINRVSSTQPFIIFIHGAGSNHSVYKPFFHAFEFHNFIALDLRNHGRSGKARLETITIKNFAKDIEAIVAEEKIQEIIIIGNSLGAAVALEFYKNNRKKTKQMVLFTLFSKRYIKSAVFFHILTIIASMLIIPFSGWRNLKFQDYHKYKERPIWYYPYLDVRGTPIGTVLKLIRELFSYSFSLTTVKIPTLLFVCIDDFITKNTVIQSDSKENKHITIINLKSYHVPLTRNYKEIIKHVQTFLQ